MLKPGEYHQTMARDSTPITPAGSVADSFSALLPPSPTDTGSNNWVLSPKWTQSHHAWFANDPHLALTSPPFWYWAHINGGELDVIGASVPGSPLVVSGLNRHVAWGLTDSKIAVGELVAVPEKEIEDFESKRPTIWFKLGFVQVPFFLKSYRKSKEGVPVLPIDAPEGRVLLMRWTGFLVTGKQLSGFPQWMLAHSAAEVDRIPRKYATSEFQLRFLGYLGRDWIPCRGPRSQSGEPNPFRLPQSEA